MRKHKLLGQRQAFRFTRWSRNAAASFHSMEIVVNIGQLRANVLERIARKCSKTLLAHLVGREVILEHLEGYDAWEVAPPDLLEQLLMSAPIAVEPIAPAAPI